LALPEQVGLPQQPALPQELLCDLRELNKLRNWIAHGFVYKTTVLVEKNSQGTYDEVDVENEVDWAKSFPRTAFNTLDSLDNEDARKGLLIALRTLAWMLPMEASKRLRLPA
jgi:hypothetical protein